MFFWKSIELAIKDKISIKIIERLSSGWYEMYGELKRFKNLYTHINVPKGYEKNKSLAQWITSQRAAYTNGQLRQERIKLLNSLGFIWDPFEIRWHNNFNQLKAFKQRHGHTDIPTKYKENPALGNWVIKQRTMYNKKMLNKNRIEALEKLGFKWCSK